MYYMAALLGDQGGAVSRCLMVTAASSEAAALDKFVLFIGSYNRSLIEIYDQKAFIIKFERYVPEVVMKMINEDTYFSWKSIVSV